MIQSVAPTGNFLAFRELIAGLGPRRDGDGRIAMVIGEAGGGKSVVGVAICEQLGLPYVRALTTQSPCDFLRALAYVMRGSFPPAHRLDALAESVVDEVYDRNIAAFVVDEGDCFDQPARFVKLNILREIADRSGAAAVLLATPSLARRLAIPNPFLAQVSSRIVARLDFKRATLRDASAIAQLIEGVRLDSDTVKVCFALARGNLRALARQFGQIERAAKAAGIEGALSLARAQRLGILPAPTEESRSEPATMTNAAMAEPDKQAARRAVA